MTTTKTFIKENFSYSGGYLTYDDGVDRHFIARFKYVPKSSATKFMNFLIKNFTCEEYLERADQEAPLKILESKGYCSPEMARLAKRWGYAPTLENAHKALIEQTSRDLVQMGEKPITPKQAEELLQSV
tara:strand:- start:21 stop:407 length:387 start_codon:yes stop_codon:yes gene_type:complete